MDLTPLDVPWPLWRVGGAVGGVRRRCGNGRVGPARLLVATRNHPVASRLKRNGLNVMMLSGFWVWALASGGVGDKTFPRPWLILFKLEFKTPLGVNFESRETHTQLRLGAPEVWCTPK